MFVKLDGDDPIRHVLGERVDGVLHMCPGDGCGWPARAFCVVCLGTGLLTEEQLAHWHRRQWAETRKNALPDRSDSALLRAS